MSAANPIARPAPPASTDRELAAWTAGLFRAIDAMDVEGFLGHLSADATFAFGNFPHANGTAAIRETLVAFYAGIRSLSHAVEDAWTVPGCRVVRGRVSYTRRDGAVVSVPFCNVLGMSGERVADYRIYIDPSPLLAP